MQAGLVEEDMVAWEAPVESAAGWAAMEKLEAMAAQTVVAGTVVEATEAMGTMAADWVAAARALSE